jgi:hypothetical protein
VAQVAAVVDVAAAAARAGTLVAATVRELAPGVRAPASPADRRSVFLAIRAQRVPAVAVVMEMAVVSDPPRIRSPSGTAGDDDYHHRRHGDA